MTTISFFCLFLILGFLSGDAVTFWCLWLSLPIIGFILVKFIDVINSLFTYKWDYSKDWKTNREIAWRKISSRKRNEIVQRYKSKRIDFINESLGKNISEWRRKQLTHELEIIDTLYNLDTPPREWHIKY